MAGYIKKQHPGTRIIFLGQTYTEQVVALSEHVDHFVDVKQLQEKSLSEQVELIQALNADAIVHVFPNKIIAKLAKAAGIPIRVGTSHRSYHWTTCNKRVSFSRKKSALHEAQLNFNLLQPFGVNALPEKEELISCYGFSQVPVLPKQFEAVLGPQGKNIILHPKSKGSAVEWGLENFAALTQLLSREGYSVFITGTAAEKELIGNAIPWELEGVTDLTGKMSLSELIAFIARCDALVAASTGPLHIAAALGLKAVGLFSERRPIHPGRWSPIGANALALTHPGGAGDAEKDVNIRKIAPETVLKALS